MKTIPAQLLTHKALTTTTICRLMKVRCRDGDVFGFAKLDEDVTYNDNSGDGAVLYRSTNGLIPTRVAKAVGTSIDPSEVLGVLLDAVGITESQVRAGKLDYADAWVYEVNYNDLTAGRHENIERGKAGQAVLHDDNFRIELRPLAQLLKQGLGEVTSVTCRARFGSQPIGTGGGAVEERRPCGKVRTWVAVTLTAVSGTEPDRIVTDSALAQAAGFFVPGVFRVLTGANEGWECEVEEFGSGVIQLSLPAPFDFAVADTAEISQDCSKLWDDADHGCLYHWGADRTLHFRGEPLLPLGQEGVLNTPGAE